MLLCFSVTHSQSGMNHKLSVNAPEFVPRGCPAQINQAPPYGGPPPFPPPVRLKSSQTPSTCL